MDSIKKEPAYLAVEKNVSGSRPKELFDDCIEEVEELFTKDRTALKDAMKQHSIEITTDSTYEEFSDALREADADLEKITLTNRSLPAQPISMAVKRSRLSSGRPDSFLVLLQCVSKLQNMHAHQ